MPLKSVSFSFPMSFTYSNGSLPRASEPPFAVVCQVPALNIFETSYRRGKFDASRALEGGGMLEFKNIYPMDAVFDTPEDVPEEVGYRQVSNQLKLKFFGVGSTTTFNGFDAAGLGHWCV